MSTWAEWNAAAVEGATEATKQGARLGLDADDPIDIFGVIEESKVWLLFERLDRLYGFFQRQADDVAGIVLNSGHPLSLQRFTAAHEYGHYVLGHSASQDGEDEVLGGGTLPLQEIQAQSFAAEFLMPLRLVNLALDRLSLPREPAELNPVSAYQLSLEIGASYRATITRLNQLNKISYPLANELRSHEPMQMKLEIGAGQAPENSRAAVWALDPKLGSRHLELRTEDELHVRLAEIPSSGYRWNLEAEVGGLEVLEDELERGDVPPGVRFGSRVTRHLRFRALEPGAGTLRLSLIRDWEGSDRDPVDQIALPLVVQAPPTGLESPTGILLPQRQALLAQA
jgi:Zn-dependent peptidase ImmA (M78 family)/predicted secreted protein